MNTPMNIPADATELHPFDARDLPNVLDRVVTPVELDTPDGLIQCVEGAHTYWAGSSVEVELQSGAVFVLDGSTTVELVGPVDVLDAPREVRAYTTRDGEVLCADHGSRWDIGVTDGYVHPCFDSDGLDAVEYCSHWSGGRSVGHSFCGSCGTDVEPAGHPDSGFVGNLFYCDNCRATAVYVDGNGYEHVDGFDYVTDTHNVEVKGSAVHRELSDTPLTITAVVDSTPYRFTATRGFVCYLDAAPYEGRLLVLGSAWADAYDEAEAHFDEVRQRWVAEAVDLETLDMDTDEGVEAVEAVEADFRAALQAVRVDLDAVEFSPKR